MAANSHPKLRAVIASREVDSVILIRNSGEGTLDMSGTTCQAKRKFKLPILIAAIFNFHLTKTARKGVPIGGAMSHEMLFSSLRLAGALAACLLIPNGFAQAPPPSPPPIAVTGRSGGQIGPDIYDSINWKGPDVIAYGFYDRLPIDQSDELEELLDNGSSFVSRVRPRSVTVAQALSLGRQALAKNKIVLPAKAVRSSSAGGSVAALQSQAAGELLQRRTLRALGFQMLAYEAAPRTAAVALNLAALFAATGLPNEAVALLDEVDRLGPLPAKGTFVNTKALAAYLRGYAEMQRGNLVKARDLLRRAHQADPFLREAGLALTVVLAQLGEAEEARKTFNTAVWRRIPAKVVLEEKTKSGAGDGDSTAPAGSAAAAASERINRPMQEMFDLSHGKEGNLPVYKFPRNVEDVVALRTKSSPKISAELEKLSVRVLGTAQLANSLDRRTPYGDWANRFGIMIGIVYLWDPALRPLYLEWTKAEKAIRVENDRIRKRLDDQYMEANKRYDGASMPCSERIRMSNAAINAFTSQANLFDIAERRYYRLWYRMSTAMVAQVGDPRWHQLLAERQQIEATRRWLNVVSSLDGKYELLLVPGARDCVRPAHRDGLESRREDELEACPDNLRGRSFELEAGLPFAEGISPKINLEFDCKGVTIGAGLEFELSAGIAEFGAGPFGEVEIEREGDVTVFVGASAGGGAGPTSGAVKAGSFVTMSREGIKNAGVKVETDAKVTARIAGISASAVTTEELFKVSFAPSVPARPRGPLLKQFRARQGGGN